jgi:hypothetical protein
MLERLHYRGYGFVLTVRLHVHAGYPHEQVAAAAAAAAEAAAAERMQLAVDGGIGLPRSDAGWADIQHFIQTFEASKLEPGAQVRFKPGTVSKDQVSLVLERARQWQADKAKGHETRVQGFTAKIRSAFHLLS